MFTILLIICLISETLTEETSSTMSIVDMSTLSACSQACIAREELRNATLANIKQEILSKLGLTTPPNIPAHIRATLLLNSGIQTVQHTDGMMGDQPMGNSGIQTLFETGPVPSDDILEKDYRLRNKKIIAFSNTNDIAPNSVRHLPLQLYRFADVAYEYKVQKAKLRMYIRGTSQHYWNTTTAIRHIEMKVFKITTVRPYLALRHMSTIRQPQEPGLWVTIDVTKLVSEWFAKPKQNYGLYVNATDSSGLNLVLMNDFEKRPFIEVHLTEGKRNRSRRSVGLNCDVGSREKRCCRHPLEVDFEEFGWDFIIAPKKYEAYYCAGECPFVFLQKYPHTHIISQVSNKPTTAGPCCAPKRLASISMLYFTMESNIMHEVLANMAVESCGCF